jgi:tripartite ATP-independent transporter DctP family solute receptor
MQKTDKLRRSVLTGVATIVFAAGLHLGTTVGANADTSLKLAHASNTDSLINQAVVKFADEVKSLTNGAITVQIFPDGQLGDEGPIADGVGSGSIDIGLGGVVDAIDARLNVVTLPFLFKDSKAVHSFLDGPAGKGLFKLGADHGFVVLGALDSGFREFALISKSVKSPADLKALKIRTPPNPVILATMKQLGALPQSVPFGQVYTALQSRIVDGVEPETRDFYDQKWYESVKYLTISNYIWTPNYWFMNKAKYDGLPADQRDAIDKAVSDTTVWYRDNLDGVISDTIAKLKAKGVTVTEVDGKPFRAMVSPVYDTFAKEWGADLIAKVRAAAE